MTATQSFRIYEILQRYFKNNDDAKTVVQEIEVIIENKFDKEKTQLSTKEDIYRLEKTILEAQANTEKRFNTLILWIVGTGIGTIGLIFTVLKMFVIK